MKKEDVRQEEKDTGRKTEEGRRRNEEELNKVINYYVDIIRPFICLSPWYLGGGICLCVDQL